MSAHYTSAPYLVTGAVIPGGRPVPVLLPTLVPIPGPPVRLDIVDMQMKQEYQYQFSLFVRSLTEIMKEGFTPKAASFQEIAGIHGMPYVPWLGDSDEARQTTRGPWLGYCNHASILFPTWHRPYLMVLEQIISDVAHGIASRLAESENEKDKKEGEKTAEDEQATWNDTNVQAWLKAAEELRLPFWDWTHERTGTEGLPKVLTDAKIEILKPKSTTPDLEVDNPLAYYTLVDRVDGFDNRQESNRIYNQSARAYFREWERTYRHPASQVNTEDDYAGINEILKTDDANKRGTWKNLTNSVSKMFNFPTDITHDKWANAWDEFSNTTAQSGSEWKAVPIEQPHNDIHLVVGGIGHMTDADTAGFDPIFYLHHCNVDRLLAFWEHIYPDYVAGTEGYLDENGNRRPFTQAGGTWIETQNEVVDDKSGLRPFRNPGYTYWTSQGTHSLLYYSDPRRDITAPPYNKYYTYPPIVYKPGGDKPDVPIKIDTDPTKLTPLEVRNQQRCYLQKYFGVETKKAKEDSGITLRPRMFEKEAPYSGQIPTGYKRIPNYREFIITVSLDPTLIKGSHVLVISVKPSSLSGPTLPDQSYEIGRVAVFSRGSSETCGNCQAQQAARVRVHGVAPVPHWIIAGIVQAQGLNRANATDDELIRAIYLSLVPELYLPDGTLHSKLQGGTPTDSESVLSGDALPHLELWSSDVYLKTDKKNPEDEEDAPYEFGDWKKHATLDKFGDIERHWY
ncbi:hypothetical protein FRC11_013883 [Ceratobasidium sp. 423]|nr:hypothetical protein FRC11_013883 [Ceratobasidium sp. 423]